MLYDDFPLKMKQYASSSVQAVPFMHCDNDELMNFISDENLVDFV